MDNHKLQELVRKTEEATTSAHLAHLEVFRATILERGHKPDEIAFQTGGVGLICAYVCPACKMAATYTVAYVLGTLRFDYILEGPALFNECRGDDER